MKHLRQYIRQVLLTEGAFIPEDLPEDFGIKIFDDGDLFEIVMVKKTSGWTRDGSGWIKASQNYGVGGEIQTYKISNEKSGHCLGAYMVSYASASDGWGPLLYDIAIEFATQKGTGLISDRESVSGDARAVWDYYLQNRGDVTAQQLDDPMDTLTPGVEEDNCDQEVAGGGHYMFGGDKVENPEWMESPLSKMYKKSPASTIEKLRSLGKLVEA